MGDLHLVGDDLVLRFEAAALETHLGKVLQHVVHTDHPVLSHYVSRAEGPLRGRFEAVRVGVVVSRVFRTLVERPVEKLGPHPVAVIFVDVETGGRFPRESQPERIGYPADDPQRHGATPTGLRREPVVIQVGKPSEEIGIVGRIAVFIHLDVVVVQLQRIVVEPDAQVHAVVQVHTGRESRYRRISRCGDPGDLVDVQVVGRRKDVVSYDLQHAQIRCQAGYRAIDPVDGIAEKALHQRRADRHAFEPVGDGAVAPFDTELVVEVVAAAVVDPHVEPCDGGVWVVIGEHEIGPSLEQGKLGVSACSRFTAVKGGRVVVPFRPEGNAHFAFYSHGTSRRVDLGGRQLTAQRSESSSHTHETGCPVEDGGTLEVVNIVHALPRQGTSQEQGGKAECSLAEKS